MSSLTPVPPISGWLVLPAASPTDVHLELGCLIRPGRVLSKVAHKEARLLVVLDQT